MKLYTREVGCCKECPNSKLRDDGYNMRLMCEAPEFRKTWAWCPETGVPLWCPLPDVGKEVEK